MGYQVSNNRRGGDIVYRCLECGTVLEEEELVYWTEYVGEYWGAPCSRMMSGCPHCHGDVEEISEEEMKDETD